MRRPKSVTFALERKFWQEVGILHGFWRGHFPAFAKPFQVIFADLVEAGVAALARHAAIADDVFAKWRLRPKLLAP